MRRILIVVHVTLLLCWAGAALWLAIDITVLSTEETRLRLQMGEDREARKQLVYERERIQAELDNETQPALLRAAVQRLELPLQPRRQPLAGRYQRGVD